MSKTTPRRLTKAQREAQDRLMYKPGELVVVSAPDKTADEVAEFNRRLSGGDAWGEVRRLRGRG